MLRFGPDDGPLVVAAPALFEEGNRTRAFLVRILRLLAERGVASVLPDVPGQGESLTATEHATVMTWREAFEALVDRLGSERRIATGLSIRGGALLDGLSLLPARWRLSPMTGDEVRGELMRILRATGFKGCDDDLLGDDGDPPIRIAGNLVSRRLWSELYGVLPYTSEEGVPIRTVRLDTDPRAADLKLPGRPLWRASEPDVDEPLAVALADDIVEWVRTCAA